MRLDEQDAQEPRGQFLHLIRAEMIWCFHRMTCSSVISILNKNCHIQAQIVGIKEIRTSDECYTEQPA